MSGSSPPPTLYSLQGNCPAQPPPGGREEGTPPGGQRIPVNHWGLFCRELVSSPHWLITRSCFTWLWTHGRLYSTFRSSTMPFVPLLSCPHSALGSAPTWLHGSSQGDQRRGQPPAPAGLPRDTTMQAGSTCPACCLRPPGPTTATRRMVPEGGEMKRCRQAPPVGGQGGSDERLRLCSPSSPPHIAGGGLTGHCPLLPSSMVLPASPLSALNCWSLRPAP